MKTRNGYVSNSSSSSFIIAYEQTGYINQDRNNPNIVDIIKSVNDTHGQMFFLDSSMCKFQFEVKKEEIETQIKGCQHPASQYWVTLLEKEKKMLSDILLKIDSIKDSHRFIRIDREFLDEALIDKLIAENKIEILYQFYNG